MIPGRYMGTMVLREDIPDAIHTPKLEGQHLSFIFDTVLGENVHRRHICNKCVTDGHDLFKLGVLLTWKVLTLY